MLCEMHGFDSLWAQPIFGWNQPLMANGRLPCGNLSLVDPCHLSTNKWFYLCAWDHAKCHLCHLPCVCTRHLPTGLSMSYCHVILRMTHGIFLLVHMYAWKFQICVTRGSLWCCHITHWRHPVPCWHHHLTLTFDFCPSLTETLTTYNFFIQALFEAPLERWRQPLCIGAIF